MHFGVSVRVPHRFFQERYSHREFAKGQTLVINPKSANYAKDIQKILVKFRK